MALPIKLTPFEWSMLEPITGRSATFQARLNFSGQLDPGALKIAVKRAQSMHPLLAATIKQGESTNTYFWIAAPDRRPYIDIATRENKFLFENQTGIDLHNEVGVRVWARYGNTDIEIRFQFHHACCDGIGAFRFMEDVMCCYHECVRPNAPTCLRPLSADQLTLRNPKLPAMTALDRLRRSLFVLPVRVARMFCQRPKTLVPTLHSTPAAATNELPTLPNQVLDRQLCRALRKQAMALGVSLNELLTRDLLWSLNGWNSKRDDSASRVLRLLIPFSLRTRNQTDMPAANCVSMVYVTANQNALRDPDRLLASVCQQLKFIQRWKIQYSWNQTLALIQSSALATWWTTRNPRRAFATSVFSNISPIFRQCKLPRHDQKICCGDLVLEAVSGAPPVNEATGISFFCNLYAGRLSLTINHDQHHFSRNDAVKLLDQWVTVLRQTAFPENKDNRQTKVAAASV